MHSLLPIENGDVRGALNGFLRGLLERDIVDAVLVSMETPSGSVTPALVASGELLGAADPLAPVMGVNAARGVGVATIRKPHGRIAAVLRPCELRALVELVKLQQADLEGLVTVVVDCGGTYTVADYDRLRADGGVDRDGYLTGLASGAATAAEGYAFRGACQMCERSHGEGADVVVELFGADLAGGIPVRVRDELGARLGLEPGSGNGGRAAVVKELVAAREAERDARFAAMRVRLKAEGVEGVLASCVRCHNCMTTCPICYCKTCVFKSPVFDHEPLQYVKWAQRKGASRLPSDTMLFHLTRLNHMVLSCVGCGMCTDACPADLPVGLVFRAIGQEVQGEFEYVPGQSAEEPLPLVTFKENEWLEVGEER